MKCHVNIDGFRKTESGKRKVWTTDGKVAHCCEFTPSYLVWEKNTRHNNYDGYSSYIHCRDVELLTDRINQCKECGKPCRRYFDYCSKCKDIKLEQRKVLNGQI